MTQPRIKIDLSDWSFGPWENAFRSSFKIKNYCERLIDIELDIGELDEAITRSTLEDAFACFLDEGTIIEVTKEGLVVSCEEMRLPGREETLQNVTATIPWRSIDVHKRAMEISYIADAVESLRNHCKYLGIDLRDLLDAEDPREYITTRLKMEGE